MSFDPLGTIKRITLHWTAGTYDQVFHDYHGCIKGDGTYVQTLPFDTKGSHCWGRNTGNVGLSFCAMADSRHPVTKFQIETMACVVAEICFVEGIVIRGVSKLPKKHIVGQALVDMPGEHIIAPNVADHAWYAKQDGYYPDRWDIGNLLDPVLAKAAWYHDQLRTNKRTPEHIK